MKAFTILLSIISIQLFSQTIKKHNWNKGEIKLKFIRAYPGEVSDEHFNLILPSSREVELICATTYNRIGNDHKNESYVTYNNFYGIYPTKFRLNNKKCREFVHYLLKVFPAVDEQNPVLLSFNLKTKLISQIQYPKIDPYAQWGDVKDLMPKPKVQMKFKNNKPKKVTPKTKPEKLEQIPLFSHNATK